jgi:hypothetical protein
MNGVLSSRAQLRRVKKIVNYGRDFIDLPLPVCLINRQEASTIRAEI